MQTSYLILAMALTVTPAAATSQSPCSAAFADSLSVRTVAAFERVAAVGPVWDDYSLGRHPLVLLADSTYRGAATTPVCAAIWKQGKPLERIELAARPPFSTPIYGMILTDAAGPRALKSMAGLAVVTRPAPAPVVATLKTHGVTRAVVLNVPLTFSSLGRLGEMLSSAKADAALIQTDLAVHESFHLHSQFPTWLDQSRTYAWPAWDLQPDRAEVRRCYAGSPELSRAFETEVQTLLTAYDAIVVDPAKRDTALGVQHARRFVDARAARRTLQDTMTVAQGDRRISCGLAEDLMELEEGATQWIGHATTVRAGLTTEARLRASYAGAQPDAFYRTGPLQLWILDALLGQDAMRRITAAIARSSGPGGQNGGVFAQFDHQTSRLAVRR